MNVNSCEGGNNLNWYSQLWHLKYYVYFKYLIVIEYVQGQCDLLGGEKITKHQGKAYAPDTLKSEPHGTTWLNKN